MTRMTRRPQRGLEAITTALLAVIALALGLTYLSGILLLLVRGGLRAFSFTWYATPLGGTPGEIWMRMGVGLALFGSAAWLVAWGAVPGVAAMTREPLSRRRIIRRLVGLLAALTCATAWFARDHLPRFLVMFPSEIRAGGGVGPEIFNSIYFAVLGSLLAFPVGVGAAVYLARFAPSRGLVGVVRVALDTLASLPSIVYGLFGFLIFVVTMRAGYSLFAGALVLALLNLPLVVSIAEQSLRAVPREVEEGSLALGATRVQTTLRITIPYAWPGLMSALVLSVGRIFAESAPLIMTAGTTVSRGNAYSLNPMRGGESLAVHLWYINSVGLSPDRADVSAATAAVLVALIGLTNILAGRLGRLGGAAGPRS